MYNHFREKYMKNIFKYNFILRLNNKIKMLNNIIFTHPPLPLSGPCLPQAPHPTQLTALYKLDCSPQVETFFLIGGHST